MSDFLTRYIRLAVEINEKRTDFPLRHRVIAIFFSKHKPLVVALNRNKTHPDIKKYGYSQYTCTTHAELAGVIELHNRNMVADSVLVVRGDGTYRSEPCSVCQAVLRGAGITKWHFVTESLNHQRKEV